MGGAEKGYAMCLPRFYILYGRTTVPSTGSTVPRDGNGRKKKRFENSPRS